MDFSIDYSALPGIAAVFAGLALFFVLYAVYAPFTARTKSTLEDDVLGAEEVFVPSDTIGKYARPILNGFLPQMPSNLMSPARKRSVEELLLKSGNPWKITAEEFVGLQFAFGILFFMVSAGIAFFGIIPVIPPFLLVAVFTFLGFLVPYSVYNSKRDSRAKEIQKQLPEALDLLTVTLTSGQTFEPAMSNVTPQLPEGLLRDEFTRVNVELAAGSSLERTLTSFYRTNSSQEAEAFSKAVIQTQKLGSDVSETLTQQADFTRENYKARIERMIAKLSTTMFIPLIATMLPALLVIFLAPTLVSLQGYLL